jgi:hypothetical protein
LIRPNGRERGRCPRRPRRAAGRAPGPEHGSRGAPPRAAPRGRAVPCPRRCRGRAVSAPSGRLRDAGGAPVPSPGERAGADGEDVVRARRPGDPNAGTSRALQLLPGAPPEPVPAVSRAPPPLHRPETCGATETTKRIDGAYAGPAEERVA